MEFSYIIGYGGIGLNAVPIYKSGGQRNISLIISSIRLYDLLSGISKLINSLELLFFKRKIEYARPLFTNKILNSTTDVILNVSLAIVVEIVRFSLSISTETIFLVYRNIITGIIKDLYRISKSYINSFVININSNDAKI